MSVIRNTKTDSWETIYRLNQSLIKSCLTHNAHIWGLQYTEKLEKIQLTFYKNLLVIPIYTPAAAVRIETGISLIAKSIFKLLLNWLIKIFEMPDNRYPKICFNKLQSLATEDGSKIKYNWFN